MRKRIVYMLIIALLLATGVVPLKGKAQGGSGAVYLPAVYNSHNPLAGLQVENVPFYSVPDVINTHFPMMAIFWFGQVRLDTNYTDVRIGYNNQALYVHVATFDRRLWYNESSDGSGLENWDSATLLLNLDGQVNPQRPDVNSYRFVTQLNWWQGPANYQATYRGNGNQWTAQHIEIFSSSLYEGNAPPNASSDNRGWKAVFKIPFASLGLGGKPAAGTIWRLGLLVHDRDSAAGPVLDDQGWPDLLDANIPSTWGRIRFGLPEYAAPAVANLNTTTIRNGLNGAVVQDTDVGGWATCGEGLNMWTQWGEKNYAGQREINIQNQQNLGDWPCFSKYFVTFPVHSIPPGKVIRSAKLVLRQFGGSDPSQASASLIQVLRVAKDWDENTINWNNAPQALENISQIWVGVFDPNRTDYCPGDAYEWDVSRAMAQAYEEGQPLRLALYSSDFDMHSGKYFYSSDSEDCSRTSRPTLIIEWGDPQ